jgi:CubicO group peptidase (beta-lactamase class C family)
MDKNWPLPFASSEEVGISAERLARLRSGMQKYIDMKKVPNIVSLIAREGKIVHYEAQGYLDIDNQKVAPKDTIFRLYSNSKPIAGVAIMMLVEDGVLSLDDPVSKYIPAFKNPVVVIPGIGGQPNMPVTALTRPAKREITVRDCLRNTTGLPTPLRAPYWFINYYKDIIARSGWDLSENLDISPRLSYRERVEAHASLPLAFDPGTDFEYHVGFPVIGVIMEMITGKNLEEFYQERIFKPLGMKDTSFYLEKEKLTRFSTCYTPKLKNGVYGLAVYDRPETSEKVKGPKVCFAPGGDMGGVLSTAADYARFAQMLLNGGELDGVRILGRKTVELMTSSHTGQIVIPMTGAGFGFGMGVGVYKGGGQPIMRSTGTFGWGGAAGTTFFADPNERLLAICFTQVMNHNGIPDNLYQEDFERLVYQALI